MLWSEAEQWVPPQSILAWSRSSRHDRSAGRLRQRMVCPPGPCLVEVVLSSFGEACPTESYPSAGTTGRRIDHREEVLDMACERCSDPSLYFLVDRLADDERRHAALFRCPACGALFEVVPEV